METADSLGLAERESMQAVLNLADPFPDTAITPTGWPSLGGQNSVATSITKYIPIAAATGTTGAWNVKIVFIPFTGNYDSPNYSAFNRSTGAVTGAVVQQVKYGQFNVWKWAEGTDEPDWVTTPPTDIVTCDPDSNFSIVRMTAAGFEAINTSAELYKGGMYYAWRSPAYTHDMTYVPGSATPAVDSLLVKHTLLTSVPLKLNEIINQNNTISSAAHSGVGCFSVPTDENNDTVVSVPTRLYMVNDISTATPQIRFPAAGALTNIYPWATCGVHIMGLAKEATFQIKCRVYYEMIPTSTSTAFMQSIARPPVPLSPLVMEMMSKVISELPAGFDYSENPLGEWFSKVLHFLSGAAPKIGAMLPLPFASTIGAAAGPLFGAIGGAVDASIAKRKAKKEAQLANAPKALSAGKKSTPVNQRVH